LDGQRDPGYATRSAPDRWARPVNLGVSLVLVAVGILVWRRGEALWAAVYWGGASINLVYEIVVAARGRRTGRTRDRMDPGTRGSARVVGRARWSVARNAYLAALPLLLLASAGRVDVAGVDVLGNGLMLVAVVLLAAPGRVLRQWVEETRRRDDYLVAGPFMSEFSDHSLRLAGWHWPWFNRVRIGVAAAGLVGWAVALSGSAFFGWS
jgi:hypothetical protein